MNISKKVVDVVKTKLSNCRNIEKYINIYWEAYDNVCNMTTNNFELTIGGAAMLLQGAMLMNICPKYASITSTIETK